MMSCTVELESCQLCFPIEHISMQCNIISCRNWSRRLYIFQLYLSLPNRSQTSHLKNRVFFLFYEFYNDSNHHHNLYLRGSGDNVPRRTYFERSLFYLFLLYPARCPYKKDSSLCEFHILSFHAFLLSNLDN